MNLTFGLDLGQQRDFSALVIAERVNIFVGRPAEDDFGAGYRVEDEYQVRHIQTWRLGTPYPSVVEEVGELFHRPGMARAQLVLDRTGVGGAVADAFHNEWQRGQLGELRPLPVTLTAGFSQRGGARGWGGSSAHKGDLIGRLLLLFENDRIKWAPGLPQVDALVKQLRGFTLKQNQRTGNLTYEAATEAIHDDLVIALALAVWWPHSKGVPRYIDHDTGELKERA